jgi:hypothetical protein
MPATRSAQKPAKPKAPAKAKGPAKPAESLTVAQVMKELEKAGSAQTKKTYLRHGATEPMFGVSFGFLATLVKRIGVDHDLALALWDTGNFDARNLAYKVVDPAKISSKDLDRWARETCSRMVCMYAGILAGESPHAEAKAKQWLGSSDESRAGASSPRWRSATPRSPTRGSRRGWERSSAASGRRRTRCALP